MFNKIKHLKDLRSQAKKLQDELSQEIIENEKHGITLKMNGNQEILGITLPEDQLSPDNKTSLEKNIKDIFEDTLKKLQRKMAEKMMKGKDISDINIPGLE
ncbi:MAG: hypothetical protein HOJ15_01765 [Candidatus Jacksonbacteria bacterium]|jgi:DNA-binding protein YbaB|nr:hypothetical protein [Candidatus Jacksonbacteria bacterium]MBT6034715.1 hypothetical protein [Candidatus Jacksonbacteria bacterium]MBT6301134.1 hypothetical protein [Candidatus Jacksonbacteria bacterium]MBT6757283.1 hypothetical protein [Candidatus Jacksonbacteria bacterium]MBT6955636.1 hypothetical protein [Candidatus Jacksonbacteria bacterium]